jgi:hypothetical protein
MTLKIRQTAVAPLNVVGLVAALFLLARGLTGGDA